jgi:glucan biosynthesis protein C
MPERRYDIDWLRVFATLVVFSFHSARFFDFVGWHVKNDQLSTGMTVFVGFLSLQWMMPLFFVLAGAGTRFALDLRPAGRYVQERVKRLLVPFIFGLIVLIPPQDYFEQVTQAGYRGGYFEFYPRFFEDIDVGFDVGWFGHGHHLWFLGSLFTFSLISLPLFLYLRNEKGQRIVSRLGAFCERRGALFLLAIPVAAIEAGFQSYGDGGWNRYTYLIFFVCGYLVFADPRFERAVARQGKLALAVGIPSMLMSLGVCAHYYLNEGIDLNYGYSATAVLWRILKGFNAWVWLVAILSFGKRYLTFNNKLLRYAADAVLPFYVLHQTVIVVIGFYVVRWHMGVMAKYLVISTASFITIMALYDLVVRRTNVTRFLFGMRLKPRRLTGRRTVFKAVPP